MGHLLPTDSQFEAFLQSRGTGESVALCHLLKFREQADYSNDPSAEPCSGREAYRRYLGQATRYIESRGGTVLYYGSVDSLLIGPESDVWDEVLLVQFPSVEAVIEMMESDHYQAISHHRMAGLEDTRLLTLSLNR